MRFFAPCPPEAENFLRGELDKLGAGGVASGSRGASFEGDLKTAYTAALYLRTASRLLLEITRDGAADEDALYRIAAEIPWEEKFPPTASFACRVTGVPRDRDPRFAVLRLKDAIADRFLRKSRVRPIVDRRNPDIRVEAHWDGRDAVIYLNWSGPPLHERGYRLEQSDTTLRETTAAAVLAMAEWGKIAGDGGAFVDPVCGSGTLLAEAAMMAIDAPPGVHRKRWGFTPWMDHDEVLWQTTLNQARVRFGEGLEHLPVMMGFDIDPNALRVTRKNLRRAGLGTSIRLQAHDIRTGRPELWPSAGRGLLCADPPYGHRAGLDPTPVYQALGAVFRTLSSGWRLALLAPDRKTAASSYLKPDKYLPTISGGMDLILGVYERHGGKEEEPDPRRAAVRHVPAQPRLDPKASALRDALQRKLSALEKWAKKSGTTSYRIWDSDMPEFNAAVDWYEGRWLHVQEFAAPAKIPRETSRCRLETLLTVLKELTGCSDENVFLKTRERGVRPYTKQNGRTERMIIRENRARFFVNFTGYLDTGIFLDHRPTRALIREKIGSGRFLNLFSYTGTATVMAALGGASATTSVDVSNTYLNWCRDNLELNRVGGKRHKLIRSDAFSWLKKTGEEFDLIFLDPPTYSNGTGREDWSVQAHHGPLIKLAMRRLKPSGTLIFSENFRRFVLDSSLKKYYHIEEVTRETLHPDFALHAHSHRCWEFMLP